jgi:hypothetical protein
MGTVYLIFKFKRVGGNLSPHNLLIARYPR